MVDVLSSPVQLGALGLANRLVLCPPPDGQATHCGEATGPMAACHARHAGAGLIVTEPAWITPRGRVARNTPGIANDAHMESWRRVTTAVREAGGRIVLQIMHGGRLSHPDLQPDGGPPVAPSPVPPAGDNPVVPRELSANEIAELVARFAAAAGRARDAGFDGVEVSAAGGTLLDQFLHDGSNRRSDAYGAGMAGRLRFLLETISAVAGAWDPGRVGVQLSPFGMGDSDPAGTFLAAAASLAPLGLAYLRIVEPVGEPAWPRLASAMTRVFDGPVVVGSARAPGPGPSFVAIPGPPDRRFLPSARHQAA